MGFAPSFRFGNPFFLAPNVDELVKRFQVKDNLIDGPRRATRSRPAASGCTRTTSRCSAASSRAATCSTASPGSCATPRPRRRAASGRTPSAARTARYVTAPATCPAGTTTTGGPLLFYLQSSSPDGIARDAAGASDINNEEFSLFVQDKWQAGHGLTIDYGLRWDAQLMPETVDPKTTAYAAFLNDPRFPSDGTIPDQGSSSSRASASRGTSARTARRCCAAAPASTTPGRTC